MNFDMGIWDTVFMIASIVLAIVVFVFVKPRNTNGDSHDGPHE